MANQSKNSVESINAQVPPTPPSPSASSSSSSQPESKGIGCLNSPDICSAHLFNQNESNLKRSAEPARLMSYRNGSWLDFSKEVIDSLKSSVLEGKPIADVQIEGSKYLFDFLRMVQIDYDTGKRRSIAWIDVNDKCYFPKIFLGEEKEEDNLMKIEIGAKLNKRHREAAEKDDDVLAKRQCLVVANSPNAKWLNSRLLTENERGYALVRDHFLAGIRKVDAGATISSIHQWKNDGHLERARFDVFKKQIELTKGARGSANTIFAWYGASTRVVESILAHGFCVPTEITNHGVGIYLSPVGFPWSSSQMAEADENGEKHLILCRVILGNVEKVPTGSQQCYPSKAEFDTGSDDPKNPKWYVVWPGNMNRNILPLCVVSYKPSVPVLGKLFEKIFSKMKSSLSPAKLLEVLNLFHSYKTGTWARTDFFKQLRAVAGVEMLSAIQEIGASE